MTCVDALHHPLEDFVSDVGDRDLRSRFFPVVALEHRTESIR